MEKALLRDAAKGLLPDDIRLRRKSGCQLNHHVHAPGPHARHVPRKAGVDWREAIINRYPATDPTRWCPKRRRKAPRARIADKLALELGGPATNREKLQRLMVARISMSRATAQGLLLELQMLRADLRRFLIARTGSEAEADDLMSELWIKVSAGQSGPIDNPKGYLFRMANNLALDKVREKRRRNRREQDWTVDQFGGYEPSTEFADPTLNAEQALIDRDETLRLADAIRQLPVGAQRVLRLHKLEGLSHGEVAERLGITRSAVEKHMAVAMTHLRRLLRS